MTEPLTGAEMRALEARVRTLAETAGTDPLVLLDENARLRQEIHRASVANGELLDAARAVCTAMFGPAASDVPGRYDGDLAYVPGTPAWGTS